MDQLIVLSFGTTCFGLVLTNGTSGLLTSSGRFSSFQATRAIAPAATRDHRDQRNDLAALPVPGGLPDPFGELIGVLVIRRRDHGTGVTR